MFFAIFECHDSNTMLKNIFIIILILTSIFYKSQNLEDLDRVTENYIDKAKYREAIDFNIENLLKFKGSKNKEGIIMVYINIAKLFCVLNEYKESSKYFEEAKTNIKNVKNPLLAGKLYLEYGISK
ncbi:hypothetical protein [Chryseobacterium sp. SIMBA_038]|uniref:hypothetical protein n=1 Tax=Chryseobacterium sp. SIMBA_038 TaxID=3085780 RepID=UPI00397AB445